MRNIILNENCLETIKKIENNNIKVNIILTSRHIIHLENLKQICINQVDYAINKSENFKKEIN